MALNAEQLIDILLEYGFYERTKDQFNKGSTVNKLYRFGHANLNDIIHIKREYKTNIFVISTCYQLKVEKFKNNHKEFKNDFDWSSNYFQYPLINKNDSRLGLASDFKDENLFKNFLEQVLSVPSKTSKANMQLTPKQADETFNTNDEPKETERNAWAKRRINQSVFRQKLLAYWGGCSVSELAIPELLIASHIKPWSSCNDKERLDIYNGLLLMPNLDALFDKGWISFDENGKILISKKLSDADYKILNIFSNIRLKHFEEKHQDYLNWHREHLFKSE